MHRSKLGEMGCHQSKRRLGQAYRDVGSLLSSEEKGSTPCTKYRPNPPLSIDIPKFKTAVRHLPIFQKVLVPDQRPSADWDACAIRPMGGRSAGICAPSVGSHACLPSDWGSGRRLGSERVDYCLPNVAPSADAVGHDGPAALHLLRRPALVVQEQ